MYEVEWEQLVIKEHQSILESLSVLEKTGSQFLVVVNELNKAIGTITDGDIRRGLMRNIPLSSPCREVMNSSFYSLNIRNYEKSELNLEDLKKQHIKYVPVLDDEGGLVKIESFDSLSHPKVRINEALILAGGLGSRLGELTKTCPKPMLKVGDKPILESILNSLKEHGIKKINISVNYLSSMIEDHFGDGSDWGVEIAYLKEDKKLGTAGPLSLVGDSISDAPLLVLNGDLVTRVDFGALLDFHNREPNVATMCVRQVEEKVPYGVVEFENGSLQKITEKPLNFYYVNAGIYVFSSRIMEYIPQDSYFDMNHLFTNLLEKEEGIGVFPIHEYWVDVGKPDDLHRARNDA